MSKCPSCGQEIQSAVAAATVEATTDRRYVSISNPTAFTDTCYVLLRHPECKDEKFKGALKDFPKTLERYGRLTEGQWKFFSVIHKNILGTWPPKPDALHFQPPEPKPPEPLDLDSVPF